MAMRAPLFLILGLMASACSAPGPSARTSDPLASAAALPLPTPRPGEARAVPPAPMPVPRPERAPSSPPFDLGRLGGASESAVVSLIGLPDAIREQQPGKVWVYSHGACRVEVFLYPSVDIGSMAVLGTALVPDTLAEAERDRCRRSLARRSAKAQ